MAVFNPNVPDTRDPSYLGFSERPKQIDKTSELGTLFKGIGSTLDAALKATDAVVTDTIKNTVNTGVDTMRNAYTNVLERVAGTPDTERVSESPDDPSRAGAALLPPQRQTPAEIGNVQSYAENLRNSYESGKISRTHYEGTLARFAKSVRDKFPGWRDEVDRAIAKATSASTPANEYINMLVADINKSMTDNRSERDKMLQIIKENPSFGQAGGAELIQGVINGTISRETFYERFVKHKGPIDAAQNQRVLLGLKKDLTADDQVIAGQDATRIASQIASNHLTNAQTINGVQTPESIQQYVQEVQSGRRQPDAATIDRMNQQVQLTKVKATQAIHNELFKIDPATGSSIAARIGTDEANKIIANTTKIYDDIGGLIRNKEFGVAFSMGRINDAMLDQTKNRLFANPKFGEFYRTLSVIGTMGPQVAEKYMQHVIGANPRLSTDLRDALVVEATRIGSGVDPNLSMVQVIEQARQRGLVSGDFNAAVLSLGDLVTNKTQAPEVRANIAQTLFKETGVIARLPTEDYKYSFFTKWTDANMATEIRNLSKLPGKEGLWQSYKDWVEHTGAKELIPQEIANLRAIQNLQGVRVGWDDANDRLIINTQNASSAGGLKKAGDPAREREIQLARRTEYRINRVLSAIRPIAEVEGTNVDSYLVGTLITLGLDPMRMDTNGLPEQIIQAIKANRLRQQKPRPDSAPVNSP